MDSCPFQVKRRKIYNEANPAEQNNTEQIFIEAWLERALQQKKEGVLCTQAWKAIENYLSIPLSRYTQDVLQQQTVL